MFQQSKAKQNKCVYAFIGINYFMNWDWLFQTTPGSTWVKYEIVLWPFSNTQAYLGPILVICSTGRKPAFPDKLIIILSA